MKTHHILGISHCQKCLCLRGHQDAYHCGIKGNYNGAIRFSGSADRISIKAWKSYFPIWCPLLKCNYKKPSDILILKRIPSGFYCKD